MTKHSLNGLTRRFHVAMRLATLGSLLVGAAATVAVSWWRMPANLAVAPGTVCYQGPGVLDGSIRLFDVTENDGFTQVWIGKFHGFVPTPGLRFERNQTRLPSWSLAKPWAGDTSQSTPPPQDTEMVEEYASGWPMLALVARRRGSVMIPMNQRATEGIWYKGTMLVRPTTPIWPGFIVDSLTLSAPLWIACGLYWAHRIGAFRHAYQCKACGYDLRGQTSPGCPECCTGRVLNSMP